MYTCIDHNANIAKCAFVINHRSTGMVVAFVYCPECPPAPGGTIVYPGGQQKKFLPFGHRSKGPSCI